MDAEKEPAHQPEEQLEAEAVPNLSLFDCPACNGRLSSPVTLPCGWSACATCLKEIVQKSMNASRASDNAVSEAEPKDPSVAETSPDASDTAANDAEVVGSSSSEPPNPTSPSRVDRSNSVSSVAVNIGSEKLYYVCPAPACPYGRHLYRKERTDFQLQRIIEELPKDSDRTKKLSADDINLQELECPICYSLLVEPITAPCGHHACRRCLLEAIDHGTTHTCPTCRSLLPRYAHFFHRPPNQILLKLLKAFHASEYRKRELVIHRSLSDADAFEPIFVVNTILPRTTTYLHVFEPRYRLMMHRAMSTTKRFGMACHTRGGFADYGTMLEIRSIEAINGNDTINGLPRFLVTCYGVYRFKVLERGTRDGYHTAIVERIEDVDENDEVVRRAEALPPPVPNEEGWETEESDAEEGDENREPGERASKSSPTLAEKLVVCRDRMEQLVNSLSPLERHHFETQYGTAPEADEDFSWYLGNVILGNEEALKLNLLKMNSVRQRIDFLYPFVDSLGSSSRRCSIM